eukprot:403345345
MTSGGSNMNQQQQWQHNQKFHNNGISSNSQNTNQNQSSNFNQSMKQQFATNNSGGQPTYIYRPKPQNNNNLNQQQQQVQQQVKNQNTQGNDQNTSNFSQLQQQQQQQLSNALSAQKFQQQLQHQQLYGVSSQIPSSSSAQQQQQQDTSSQGSFGIGGNTSIIQNEQHNDTLSSFSGSQFDMLDSTPLVLGQSAQSQISSNFNSQGLIAGNGAANNLAIFNAATSSNLQLQSLSSQNSNNSADYGMSSFFSQFKKQSQTGFNVFDVDLKSYDTNSIIRRLIGKQEQSALAASSQATNSSVKSINPPDEVLNRINLDENTFNSNIFTSPYFDQLSFEEQLQINSVKTPTSYEFADPPLKYSTTLKQFIPNVLFYIFYNLPHDRLQVEAYNELISRGWMYHQKNNKWYILAIDDTQSQPQQTHQQSTNGSAAGSKRSKKTAVLSQTKAWFTFDTNLWKRVIVNQLLRDSDGNACDVPPSEELSSVEIQLQAESTSNQESQISYNSRQNEASGTSNSQTSSQQTQGIGRGSIIRRKQTQRGGRPMPMNELNNFQINSSSSTVNSNQLQQQPATTGSVDGAKPISYQSLVINSIDD